MTAVRPDIRIAMLDHKVLATATRIHRVLARAHAQEIGQLAPEHRLSAGSSLEEVQRSQGCYLGAHIDDELVGAVSLAHDDEPGQLRVMLLFVDPQYQRRGIARTLMQEVLRRAAGTVVSVVTLAANTSVLALYSDMGFAPYRRGLLGSSGIELVKLRNTGS